MMVYYCCRILKSCRYLSLLTAAMKKILVLDDNIDILEMIKEVLSYEHFEVRGLIAGANILSAAVEFRPDLMILDYRLQDSNSGELCRMFKSHPTFKNVPVIICTAYIVPSLNLTEFRCDAVITKPFDIDNLVDTVNRLIDYKTIL